MNRKKYLFCFIIVAFLLSIFCSANAEAHPITLTLRLQLVTFQSDFVTFDWTFSVNETIPNLNMSLVIPIDVVNGSLANGFESAPIEGNVDTSNNVTTFSIDYPLPIATAGGAFPNDGYNATYYIGCNFLLPNQNLHFGADIPGPTDNYQASWSLDSYPEFTQKLQSEFPVPPSYGSVGNETLWMKLDLTIFHRQPFQQYLDTLVNTVPAGLEVFGVIMAAVLFLPLI